MLISLATMNFRLCHLLREKLIKSGFSVEQIIPGDLPSKGSILVVTTEDEQKISEVVYQKLVVLSHSEILDISRAFPKIMLGIEGKRIWECLIIGVDPGQSIGVAVITDGCLRSTLETRVIAEAIDFILEVLEKNPTKMAIIRVGSTGGYRRILILNELLNVKPADVTLEVVDEEQTTPATFQDVKEIIDGGTRDGISLQAGKDASAAMEIAFRIGESVKSPETWVVSDGELKEIQVLSRQYSRGKVTISKELAKKVAAGLLTLEEAIEQQKSCLDL
ncbi:MAG: hypothetical protein JXA54_14760 [Candidatus Heimdallarchaeota archaeon]|nr:hypothetical protein [Candidatus Heimdallarchaeota archaeon]